MTWYYVKDGEAAGPIDDEEFVSKLRIGAILPTTLVWRAGMPEWQAASKVTADLTPPPTLEHGFSPALGTAIAEPPEIVSGPPPVLPHFFCTVCGNIIPADQLVRISERNVCAACKPGYVRQVSEGLNAPLKAPVIGSASDTYAVSTGPDSDLADPASRLVAYILDLVFITVPMMVIYFLFIVVGVVMATSNSAAPPAFVLAGMFAFLGLALLWCFFYWTWFIGRRGATPGMKIMKIKMVRADRTPVSYARAFGRAALLYVINAFTMGLTNISAFFDREKRTVVDMACDTRVVRN